LPTQYTSDDTTTNLITTILNTQTNDVSSTMTDDQTVNLFFKKFKFLFLKPKKKKKNVF